MATNVAKLKQENLTNLTTRGSEKLLRAWKERGITEAAVREIADALDKSPAKVEGVTIVGGQNPTGVQLSLRYDGDDGPWCGNDILFWLKLGTSPMAAGAVSSTHQRSSLTEFPGPRWFAWNSASVRPNQHRPRWVALSRLRVRRSMGNPSPTGIAPIIQVHPSRRCNLACAHCYSMSGPTARGDLHLEILSTCLRDAFDLGYRQLAVSGGEPLLYKPLEGLLACARRIGMLMTITSNGMLVTAERWESLAPLVDMLAISIDGTEPEHDRIRCHDGAFARTVENFKFIRASGVPFGIIFTLTQHNVDSLEFVVRLAQEHGACSVQVHPLTLHGRAAMTLPDSRPDGIELVAAVLQAAQLAEQLKIRVHVEADPSTVTGVSGISCSQPAGEQAHRRCTHSRDRGRRLCHAHS